MNTPISGDRMEGLYQQYKQQLFQYVLSRVRHREVAEDIVSSVFILFFQYLLKNEGTPGEYHYRGLLYKITKNQISNHFRANRQDQSIDIAEIDVIDEESLTPFEQTDQILSVEKVEETIAALPEYYQELIRLRYIAQLEYSEIAQLLEKKEGTIRVALHRAIKMAQEFAKGPRL